MCALRCFSLSSSSFSPYAFSLLFIYIIIVIIDIAIEHRNGKQIKITYFIRRIEEERRPHELCVRVIVFVVGKESEIITNFVMNYTCASTRSHRVQFQIYNRVCVCVCDDDGDDNVHSALC